jgi:3-hydroxybutyryl-CoA dehydrogenase
VSQPAETQAAEEPRRSDGALTETLAVAGSGAIACGLAACVALRGERLVLWARSPASAGRAWSSIEEQCERSGRAAAIQLVRVTHELSELRQASMVVEAIVESEPAKEALLRSLGERLGGDSLIATTTSSLSVSKLAEASGRSSRFFGLHLFNPVQKMELVEVCFPAVVEGDTRSRALAFCEAIGKTAVEVPDESGFVVNRLLFPYLFDAVRMLERTNLEPPQVDACMKLGASHPMGPLELLDLVGLDVAEAIGEAVHAETGEPAHRPPGRLKSLVREGRLGRKSGGGFYRYSNAE